MTMVERVNGLNVLFETYRTHHRNSNFDPKITERNISVVKDFLYNYGEEALQILNKGENNAS